MSDVETILVTGASGFIGRVLCEQLKARGKHVRVMLRSQISGPWDEAVISDLTGLSPNLMDDVSVVFHLAGKAHALSEAQGEDSGYHDINVSGTKNLLEVAKQTGVNTFVYFSSVKAIGDDKTHCQNETSTLLPDTPYGKSKLAAERLVINGGFVVNPVVVRPAMVYGITTKGNLPRMIRAIQKNRFPPFPEIENQRSMVHVDDLVSAAILASEKPEASGNIYHVTDEQLYSTTQIYEWACKALGRQPAGWRVPVIVLRLLGKIGDLMGKLSGKRFIVDTQSINKLLDSACYSSAKISKQLCFKPVKTLQQSMPEIVDYVKSHE